MRTGQVGQSGVTESAEKIPENKVARHGTIRGTRSNPHNQPTTKPTRTSQNRKQTTVSMDVYSSGNRGVEESKSEGKEHARDTEMVGGEELRLPVGAGGGEWSGTLSGSDETGEEAFFTYVETTLGQIWDLGELAYAEGGSIREGFIQLLNEGRDKARWTLERARSPEGEEEVRGQGSISDADTISVAARSDDEDLGGAGRPDGDVDLARSGKRGEDEAAEVPGVEEVGNTHWTWVKPADPERNMPGWGGPGFHTGPTAGMWERGPLGRLVRGDRGDQERMGAEQHVREAGGTVHGAATRDRGVERLAATAPCVDGPVEGVPDLGGSDDDLFTDEESSSDIAEPEGGESPEDGGTESPCNCMWCTWKRASQGHDGDE